VRTVAVVRLPGSIAVDLFEGDRRLARLPVTGADPAGGLAILDTFGEPRARVQWRNPDGRIVAHDYAVGPRSLSPIS
jgi:hypothetical protein